MIPEQSVDLTALEIVAPPSLTYKLDLEHKRITGLIDEQEAVLQAVEKIFLTELNSYIIYGPNYGIELQRFIGQDYDFIVTDLERTISDAVLADDRILSISDFNIEKTEVDQLSYSVTINSIYGSSQIIGEVQI
jgi:hypothetical protein